MDLLIVTLSVRVVAIFVFSDLIVFIIMRRDYDSAVMTVGFIGFAMGATF